MSSAADISDLTGAILASHPVANSFAAWVETVTKTAVPSSISSSVAATKTVFLKPKGGKLSTPILVVALADSPVGNNAIAKHLGAKEARVAADDLTRETFGVEKLDVTPFVLKNVADKSTLTVLIDEALLADADRHLVFRGFAADASLYVAASKLKAFLEAQGVRYTSVNLVEICGAPGTASPPAPKKVAEKPAAKAAAADDGKEILIGITAKKEEDFPSWYQQ
ncbi:hypothetical protein BDK51DRAFT_29778, partial [Blyttiomyces helicus]